MWPLIPFSFSSSVSLMPWELKLLLLGPGRLPRALSVFEEKQMKTTVPLTAGWRDFFCVAKQILRSPSVCHYLNSSLIDIWIFGGDFVGLLGWQISAEGATKAHWQQTPKYTTRGPAVIYLWPPLWTSTEDVARIPEVGAPLTSLALSWLWVSQRLRLLPACLSQYHWSRELVNRRETKETETA